MTETLGETDIKTSQLPPNSGRRTFLLDLDTFREHLAQLAKQSGGNSALGERLGITGQYVDFLIKGTRTPGRKILKAIGARRKVMIEIDVEESNGTDS